MSCAPPVETVDRIYSLNEVRRSERVRDKVRRIDLSTINFNFGSAEITQEEVGDLQALADAIARVIAENPDETFLIEGHTDAVGSERANLARHFAPTMVDEIASHDRMLEVVQRQDVAVMFADVVGFTRLAEQLAPEATVAVLRGLHRRIEKAVFDHDGTLDKFLGDGAMATFGTPRAGPRDAANALGAARAALDAVDKWNAKRAARGAAPVRLSVGLHYGSVVLGDLGSDRRLEYAVIGDTVNVAARIEHLTRELDARIALSDALVKQARDQGADLAGLEAVGAHDLRGRNESVVLWRLPRQSGSHSEG